MAKAATVSDTRMRAFAHIGRIREGRAQRRSGFNSHVTP
jgi:hypothetical protein